MRRRQFLSLLALPLAAAIPVAQAEHAAYRGTVTLPHVVKELFETLDCHHLCAMAVVMSDGTMHGIRGVRLEPRAASGDRPYPHYPEHVTNKEKAWLRLEMAKWLESR